MARRNQSRMLACMRNLMAQGWTEEALLVDTAAQLTGGDEQSKLEAQRVFDAHLKIHTPN